MKAFVSGVGGFIGRTVVGALARRGDTVIAHVGPPGLGLAAPPQASHAVHCDIADAAELEPLLRGCQVVVHLAGPASVAASFEAAESYVRAHALGTAALMSAARAAAVPRFVYVSSAEVYGRADDARVREDAPLRPRSPYAAAKAGAEAIVGAAARAGGPSAVVLRPFSVYGPGQRAESLLAQIVAQALRGNEVALRDLAPVRDYVHAEDVARAALLACDAAVDELAVANVGSGVGTSVAALAEAVFAVLGRHGTIRALGADRGAAEIYRLVADPTTATELLGWRSRIGLRSGIATVLEPEARSTASPG